MAEITAEGRGGRGRLVSRAYSRRSAGNAGQWRWRRAAVRREGAGAQSLELERSEPEADKSFRAGTTVFLSAPSWLSTARVAVASISSSVESLNITPSPYPPITNTQSRLHATLSTHTTQRDGTRVRSQRPHSVTARDGSPFMSLPATGAGSGTPSRDRLPVPLTPLAPGALLLGGRDASAAGATSTLLRISARSFSSAAPMMHCSAACLIDI